MQTSVQWWNKTKNNPEKLNSWLLNQATCELEAEYKLNSIKKQYVMAERDKKLFSMILEDEANHANWLAELCLSRGLDLKQVKTSQRYWKKASKFKTLDDIFAIAAHAEIMRLDRIKAIVNDSETPKDIKFVFQKILKDELFHAKAFKTMASKPAFVKQEKNHKAGMKAIGLRA